MRNVAARIGLSALLAAGCLTGAAGTAHADTASAERLYAPSALVLTLAKGEDPVHSTVQRATLLRCSPTPGGDHPAAASACAGIAAVRGDFTALSGHDPERVCTKIYDPVIITAQGVWNGRRVEYREMFPNECEMLREKGEVFAF